MKDMSSQKVNYYRLFQQQVEQEATKGHVPKLLLHSCCAPCSSAVLELLSRFFSVTVFYYNPNITEKEEYAMRVAEQRRLIEQLPVVHSVSFLEGDYEPDVFLREVSGLEACDEGGERCTVCYRMRLAATAKAAVEGGFDYFTTTLSISPRKDAARLNEIGKALSEEFAIAYLYSDFKQRDGYKRSVELSTEYQLYRQDYCGCVFSRAERERRKQERAKWTGGHNEAERNE